MHICLMTRTTLAHIKGGMEHHADVLCRGLVARGHRITVITTRHPEGQAEIAEPGIRTLFLPHSADRAYAVRWWGESARAFARLHATDPMDLIWSQEDGAYGIVRTRYPVPCVTILHGTPLGDWRGKRREWELTPASLPRKARFALRTLLFHRRTRTTCRRSDAVIAVSPQLADDARREFGLQPAIVHVILNGVDAALFAPDEAARQNLRARLGIPRDAFVLLTAGRLERAKGHHLALRVVAALRAQGFAPHLLVAGSGPDEAWLREEAVSLGLSDFVHWLGHVPREEMPAAYDAADVALMLSLRTEAFPYAVVEAMACGRPVVASRVGGIPAAIADERDGFLVATGDANAAAERVLALARDSERRAAMGQAARQTVLERFTLERMVADTEAVFLRLAAGRGAQA